MPNIFSRPTTIEHVSTSRGSMPKGVDPRQWDSNPYANFDYKHSGWQQFLEGLGLRSKFDEYRESMAVNAAEYDAQLAEKAHNEEYDSPLAQVERQRQAGLNPDLNGSVDSGSSSAMEPDPNAPISPESDGFDDIMNFGSIIMQGVQMAFGLTESGIGLASGLQSLRSQNIENDNKILDTAYNALGYLFHPTNEEFPAPTHVNNYVLGLQELFGHRRSKKYLSAVNKIADSLKGSDYEYTTRNHRAGERVGFFDKISSPGYDEVSEVMYDVRHTLQTDLWDALTKNAQASKEQADYDYRYAKQMNKDKRPERMADLSLAEREGQVTALGQENQMRGFRLAARNAFDNLIEKMNQRADEGNNFASFLSVVLGFLGVRWLGF